MLLPIKQEHRDILADLEKRGQLRGVVRSVPDNTAPHIVGRLTDGLAALCENRSISEADERCYQIIAERRAYQLQSYARIRRRAHPESFDYSKAIPAVFFAKASFHSLWRFILRLTLTHILMLS